MQQNTLLCCDAVDRINFGIKLRDAIRAHTVINELQRCNGLLPVVVSCVHSLRTHAAGRMKHNTTYTARRVECVMFLYSILYHMR